VTAAGAAALASAWGWLSASCLRGTSFGSRAAGGAGAVAVVLEAGLVAGTTAAVAAAAGLAGGIAAYAAWLRALRMRLRSAPGARVE
jgi:hypothetical protein